MAKALLAKEGDGITIQIITGRGDGCFVQIKPHGREEYRLSLEMASQTGITFDGDIDCSELFEWLKDRRDY